jgi:hypothetical protein
MPFRNWSTAPKAARYLVRLDEFAAHFTAKTSGKGALPITDARQTYTAHPPRETHHAEAEQLHIGQRDSRTARGPDGVAQSGHKSVLVDTASRNHVVRCACSADSC